MEINEENLMGIVEKARVLYHKQDSIACPYFQSNVMLTSDGFNHLQYKNNRMPRNVDEQILKLTLLPLALNVIRKTGTLQEYRCSMEKIGKKGKDGFYKMKQVKYWGFHAIIGDGYAKKIVVVLRRVGEGNITFWSVMPHKKFNNQKLYEEGIKDL